MVAVAVFALWSAGQVAAPRPELALQRAARPPDAELSLVWLNGTPGVRTTVNGHLATLLVDTGSFEFRLSPQFVRRWNVDRDRVSIDLGLPKPVTSAALVEGLGDGDADLAVGPFRPVVDGILGLDVLREFAFGVDPTRAKIAVWARGRLLPTDTASWLGQAMPRIPLRTRSSTDWFRTDVRVNARPLDLIMDTGTVLTTINPSRAAALHLREIGTTRVQKIGRSDEQRIVAADAIGFGVASAEFPFVCVDLEDDKDSDGILGMSAVGSAKLLLDFPGKGMYVRSVDRVSGSPLEIRLQRYGLFTFPRPDHALAVVVRADSLAARAGIQSGDAITAIAGVPLTDVAASAERARTDHAEMAALVRLGIRALEKNLELEITRSGIPARTVVVRD